MASWLLKQGRRESILAAVAFLMSADMYLRPSECLAMQQQHVVRPLSSKLRDWAVVIAPLD
eukprot:5420095-Lingulodinium_polyedra.AAC.1